MEEKERVIKMFEAALRDYFRDEIGARQYSYIEACSFKRVLLEAFGMSEEELKEIENAQRPK